MDTFTQNSIPITIGDEKIFASKDVLIQKSEFFEGMFRTECKESNSLQIKLIDTNAHAFKFVINMAHAIQIPESTWKTINVCDLMEATIIAGQYRFNEAENLLSERVAKLFLPFKHCVIEDSGQKWTNYSDIWDIYEKAKCYNLFALSQLCMKYLDEYADDVVEYLNDGLNRQHVSIHTIVDLFSRDSFGVNELQIFNIINDIVTNKNVADFDEECAKSLIDTIRLSLINEFDMYSTVKQCSLLSRLEFNKALNESRIEDKTMEEDIPSLQRKRVCHQIGKMFSVNHFDIEQPVRKCPVMGSMKKYTSIMINLPMPTKINHIKFKLITENSEYHYARVFYNCDFKLLDQSWHRKFNTTRTPCFGSQDLYFDEMIVDAINIVGEIDSNIVATKFTINSFHYGYSLFNEIISRQQTEDYLSNSDSVCFLQLPPVRDLKNLTDYVLRDNECYKGLCYLDVPNHSAYDTVYYIRLPQIFTANGIQIHIIQEKNQTNPYATHCKSNVTSNYKIDVCDTFDHNFGSSNWRCIAQKNILNSGVNSHKFDESKFLLIRITGYRLMETGTKFPLHIKRVKLFKF